MNFSLFQFVFPASGDWNTEVQLAFSFSFNKRQSLIFNLELGISKDK